MEQTKKDIESLIKFSGKEIREWQKFRGMLKGKLKELIKGNKTKKGR